MTISGINQYFSLIFTSSRRYDVKLVKLPTSYDRGCKTIFEGGNFFPFFSQSDF